MHSFCVTTIYFCQFSICRFASFTSRTTHWKKDLCLNQQFLPILSRACPLFYTLWNEWVRHGTLGCKNVWHTYLYMYSILVKSVLFSGVPKLLHPNVFYFVYKWLRQTFEVLCSLYTLIVLKLLELMLAQHQVAILEQVSYWEYHHGSRQNFWSFMFHQFQQKTNNSELE